MAGIDNLTPWKKGQSGNPDGRPKRVLSDRALIVAEQTHLAGKPLPPGMTVADMVVLGWLKKAMQGDAAARKDLLDRLEGKVVDKLEVGGPNGGPVPVEFGAACDVIYGDRDDEPAPEADPA